MRTLGIASVLAIAAGAQAGFEVSSIDMGGSGASFGSPIVASTNITQNAIFGNNYPPSSAFITLIPDLAFDSYIAIDNKGPSTPAYTAAAPGGAIPTYSATTGFFSVPNQLKGGYFTGGGVADSLSAGNGTGPNGTYGGVFIGRLAVSFLGTLSGAKTRVLITDSSWIGTATIDFVLNGGEGAIVGGVSSNGSTVSGLGLKAYNVGGPLAVNSSTGVMIYDLWIEEIPAPGAAGLVGVAGLAALRRRRA